jgi:very-short-patch-repair endonuclease
MSCLPKLIKNLKIWRGTCENLEPKVRLFLLRDVLKAKQYWPYQFNRQFIIGDYIVDFVSRKLHLIIEIDGSSHLAKSEADYKWQLFLENQGYTVIRFPESLVVYRIDEVVTEIDYAIQCLEQSIEDKKHDQS